MDLHRPLTLITPTVDADVLAVLAGAAASFTGREVHRVAGRHSERGVRNALHRLRDQGIVTRERIGSADSYRLNRAHLAAPHIEAMVRLRSELFARIASELGGWRLAPDYAAVFGSAARGSMRPDSDIDLFVVRPAAVGADDETWRQQLDMLSERVSAWTGNDARVFELSSDEVSHGLAAGEPVLAETSADAITVFGPGGYLRRTVAGGPGSRA